MREVVGQMRVELGRVKRGRVHERRSSEGEQRSTSSARTREANAPPETFGLPSPLTSLTRARLIKNALLAGLLLFIGCGCGSTPSPPLSAGADAEGEGEELEGEGERSLVASIPDREAAINAIERAGGVPCGLADMTQRAALPAERWQIAPGEILVQLECAFFGLQGVYEYWLLSAGEAQLISFSDSEPLQIPLPGRPAPERSSPASRERDRDMLCGRPSYEAESELLESACLGQGGRCGAYSRYRLDREGRRFEAQERRMQPCTAASELPPAEWPTLR